MDSSVGVLRVGKVVGIATFFHCCRWVVKISRSRIIISDSRAGAGPKLTNKRHGGGRVGYSQIQVQTVDTDSIPRKHYGHFRKPLFSSLNALSIARIDDVHLVKKSFKKL